MRLIHGQRSALAAGVRCKTLNEGVSQRAILIMAHQAKQNDIVIPGDALGLASKYTPGQGTTVRRGNIYSTLVGKIKIETSSNDIKGQKLPTISVQSGRTAPGVPEIGSWTIGRVMNINERQAKVSMMSINGGILQQPLLGVIRREDVREMEKDSVEIFDSFRPGDMVRAHVISLGEGQMYVLSTAANELGVVMAHCGCGQPMVPVSWCEMQCRETGEREKRKVAKVIDAVSVP